MPFNFTAT